MEGMKPENNHESTEKIRLEGIIAGFPGIGKSTLVKNLVDFEVVDLDSVAFRQDEKWPNIYIEEIIQSVSQNDAVLISTYPEVIEALVERGFPVTVVYPSADQKDVYQRNYLDRAKNIIAAQGLVDGFDNNLEGIKSVGGCRQIQLEPGQYLSDILDIE